MKAVIVSDERLKELVQLCLDDIFRSPDASRMTEKVDHSTVNYHLCILKERIQNSSI